MSGLPKCPKCSSEFTYEDGNMFVCPECAHEWPKEVSTASVDAQRIYKDAFGNVLADGDSVTVIKDLKVKGSSLVVKVGTKVKNIRLVKTTRRANTPCMTLNYNLTIVSAGTFHATTDHYPP